jgi:Virulence factor BrkB
MLLWIALTVGFREFAERWPGYDANYGVFATLVVGLIWLWLTNVSVLLGGAFAHELDHVPDRAPGSPRMRDAGINEITRVLPGPAVRGGSSLQAAFTRRTTSSGALSPGSPVRERASQRSSTLSDDQSPGCGSVSKRTTRYEGG